MVNNNFTKKLNEIELIVSDVDGVLTDGGIYISSGGEETKKFCVEDGTGVALAKYANLKLALLSGRYSKATSIRAKELQIEHCFQGFLNKREKLIEICEKLNVSLNRVWPKNRQLEIPRLVNRLANRLRSDINEIIDDYNNEVEE